MKIYELFEYIQSTRGLNARKRILKENMSEIIKLIFFDTYVGPKYQIDNIIPPSNEGSLTIDHDYGEFHKAFISLGEHTDLDPTIYLQSVVEKYDNTSQEILYKIINGNLPIGISWSMFVDIISGADVKFELAQPINFNEVDVNRVDGTYFASQCLKGYRYISRILHTTHNYDVSIYSSTGEEITLPETLIDQIKSFVDPMGLGEWVLDGFIYAVEDGVERPYDAFNDQYVKNLKYKLYDIMPATSFDDREYSVNFSKRYMKLLSLINDKSTDIEVIHQERIIDEHFLDEWEESVKKLGWDSYILRRDTPYRRGKTTDFLKVNL